MRRRFLDEAFGVALLGLALLACKKKEAPAPTSDTPTVSTTRTRYDELAPKMKARLEKLAAMSKQAESEPKVKKEKPFATKLEDKQFIVIGDRWLDNPHYEPNAEEIDLDDTNLSLCSYATKSESPKDDDNGYMEECLAWKHVAVVRARKIVLPVVDMQSKTFEPGKLDGDLLLFDLSTGEIVGRYLLGITNSDELKWFEGRPEQDWKDESKRDLVENVRGVVSERLRQERDTSGKPG